MRKKILQLSLCSGLAVGVLAVDAENNHIVTNAPSTTSKPADLEKDATVTLAAAPHWTAVLKADGSGYFGSGSAALSYAYFPAGTFSVNTILSGLKRANPTGAATTPHVVIWHPDASPEHIGISDLDAAAIYELFRRAYKSKPSRAVLPSGPEQAWKANPPMPSNKRWDDPVLPESPSTQPGEKN
jgi:hypothetical protein